MDKSIPVRRRKFSRGEKIKPIVSIFAGYDDYLEQGFKRKGKIKPTLSAISLPQSVLQKFLKKESVDLDESISPLHARQVF